MQLRLREPLARTPQGPELQELLSPWPSLGFAFSWGQGLPGKPSPGLLSPTPQARRALAEGLRGSGGGRSRFLLTLQVAEEALGVEFIIDEESGCASALRGQGRGHLGTGCSW